MLSSAKMISANEVTKTFGTHQALKMLSIDIDSNQTFGLLGPNGAGKSTFIGLIYGAIERSSGELRVFGKDPNTNSQDIKKRLGVVTQDNALDESLTVFENMLLYAACVGVPKSQRQQKIKSLLEYFQIDHRKDAQILSLSGGMKRRLVFVRALLNSPELLILDEPTTGLDPAVRHLLWGKVKELRRNGTTVLLTTHYMHEAEVLCDNLVIMNSGEIISTGSPRALIDRHTPGFVGHFLGEHYERIVQTLDQHPEYIIYRDSNGVFVRTSDINGIQNVCRTLQLEAQQIRPANLEDVFLKLTGREISYDA